MVECVVLRTQHATACKVTKNSGNAVRVRRKSVNPSHYLTQDCFHQSSFVWHTAYATRFMVLQKGIGAEVMCGWLREWSRRHDRTEQTGRENGANGGERTEQTTRLLGEDYGFARRGLLQSARSIYAERPLNNCGAGARYMRSEGSAYIFDACCCMKAKRAHKPFLMQRYKKNGGNARIPPYFFCFISRYLRTPKSLRATSLMMPLAWRPSKCVGAMMNSGTLKEKKRSR